MKRTASQRVVTPYPWLTGTINTLTPISLHSTKTPLPHLFTRPQRKEYKELQARRKWSENTMKKRRCCAEAAGVDNRSQGGAWRNEMVLRATLLLSPLVTVTHKTWGASCTTTAVTILGRTERTLCTVDPYLAQRLRNVSATASWNSLFASTENQLLPKCHQGHRQLWNALLSAGDQMPQVQRHHHHHDLLSSTRKMCFMLF